MGEWKEKHQTKQKREIAMRLMMVVDLPLLGEKLVQGFYGAGEMWQAEVFFSAEEAKKSFRKEEKEPLTALLLQGRQGDGMGRMMMEAAPVCAPVTLALLAEGEKKPAYADCAVVQDASPEAIAALMEKLIKKPLPVLAAARREETSRMVCSFLSLLGMERACKGRAYARWCFERCVPSPVGTALSMQEVYAGCARAFHTTGAAVERCLRAAVENVFTLGNLCGAERFYGSISDPERGKPTNRVFLMHGVEEIRSLLDGAALGKKQ